MRLGPVVVLCGLVVFAGCGSREEPVVSTVQQPITPLTDVALTGVVSSGSQPIVGAHVYLFAANTTGYGGAGLAAAASNASVPVVSGDETGDSDAVGAYVLTGANGNFSLTGDYACSSGQQLYLYALGGNTGSGVNSAAGLMAVVGSCPASGASAITATVNEVTTVAAAYAIAGFATDATHVSSSGTALAQVGIANAFANAANLASLSTGTALATTPAGNGTLPQTEINTLANILASCVNTASSCSTLLATATADGTATGTKPTDTATAAINIAHHPGANVAALYGMASAVFSPKLSVLPNDWTVALNFGGGGMGGPNRIAIDGPGNAWIANENNSVTELSNSGAILSGVNGYTGGGLNMSKGIAIDDIGNAWITNYNTNSVTKLSSTGTVLSGANGYTGGGLNGLVGGIAIDGSGNAWITDFNGSGAVTEISSSGTYLSGSSGYSGGGIGGPWGIAIDGTGNAWIADVDLGVSEISSRGAFLSGANGYIYSTAMAPGFNDEIAIDGSGNVWITNYDINSVSELSNSGAILSGANGYTGGGLDYPFGIAIDGSGNVWITNQTGNSVTELSSSGSVLSGTTGYTGGGLQQPRGIAIDGSGNVWVTNYLDGIISEFIGAGTPVITPICAGLSATPTANGTSKLGTRP